MQPYKTESAQTLKLRFQDTETKLHHFLWYVDLIEIIMNDEKSRIVVEHSRGKIFVDGSNLEALAVALHDEKVSKIGTSTATLSVIASDPTAVKIDSVIWEAQEEEV